MIEGIEYGVTIIKGDSLSGKIMIKNGKIAGTEVNERGKIIQCQDAIFY